MKRIIVRRQGVTAVLAMLYLMLFSTLAVGFYAATTISSQVAANDQQNARALMAAESGMDFMRYQLAQVTVPAGQTGTTMLTTVKSQLEALLDSTANLGGQSLGWNGSVVTVPSINLGNGSSFTASISLDGTGNELVVSASGASALSTTYSRAVSMNFKSVTQGSPMFAFGFVTGGPLSMTGSAKILGGGGNPANASILSTYTGATNVITMTGTCQIGGDISMVHATGNVQSTGSNSIAGTTNTALWPSHIHKGVTAPVFPSTDTSAFLPYATGTVLTSSPPAGTSTFNNGILIKANANPSFTGNKTINGVIYIETPNDVRFTGTLNLTGCIVVQNNPTGNPATNKLTFTGNMNQSGPENLPSSYGNLRNMTGSCMVAPKFDVSFTGSGNTMGGTIMCDKLTLTGSSGGTVNGSVLVRGGTATTFTGSNPFTITPSGAAATPAGYAFQGTLLPLPDSYEEH